jgi:protein gp37
MPTKIEWTDETWKLVTGCVKVSPGCKHCYAETFAERFRGKVMPGALRQNQTLSSFGSSQTSM